MPHGLVCAVCGGTAFSERTIIWDALAAEWELSAEERVLVDRQQGCHCEACGSNLRSIALAEAILAALGAEGTLHALIDSPAASGLALLELNEAGTLSPALRRLPGHRFGAWPEVDMQAMPFQDGSFDLVLHSDTLEHVPDPLRALQECRRVLRPGGALCFTVPTLPGRMTRSRAGMPPSYHGGPETGAEDYRVQTEFGADMWTWVLRAGFEAVTVTPFDYPNALAITGWRGRPVPLLRARADAETRARLAAVYASTSWRITGGLRAVARRLRGGGR
ncbi:class I SAM-dependent methyltransferase [Roseicella aerolata]|uniref:Methyltransferase domain-containing protein n=1 Tax=Roseicella aerolata TaxID=2883479 RepID=A0A9X1IBZ0_9PROT|nr:methyltransferase domain-containing protein [Roseicella aerolata]